MSWVLFVPVSGAGGETRTPTSRGNQILLTSYGFRRPLLQKSQQELFVVWTFSSPYLYWRRLGGCRQVSTPSQSFA